MKAMVILLLGTLIGSMLESDRDYRLLLAAACFVAGLFVCSELLEWARS